MIWIEQPVQTGFTQGPARARNEYDVAEDFIGFFRNWQKVFGIKNYKIYMTVRQLSAKAVS
jgi:carboxypeptidase D